MLNKQAAAIVIAGAAAMAPDAASAGSYRAGPFDGFYVAGGGTWENYDTKIKVYGVDIDDAIGNPLDTSGVEAGRVLAGFGMSNKGIYGGIEGFASFTGAEIVFPFDTDIDAPGLFDPSVGGPSSLFIRAKHSFGGSARVGAFITSRAMVFIKGTATSTSFEGGASGSILNGTIFQGGEATLTDNVTAFGYGAGVEFAVSKNAFIRADYDRLWYSDFEIDIPELQIDPNYKAVTLSVGFRF